MVEIIKTKQNEKDWRLLEFYVPIDKVEEVTRGELKEGIEPDFLIRGVAINETTTLNNVKYVAEELQKAAPTWRNVPILLDHKNEIKSIVGRTTENVGYSIENKRIEYEAKIMDKDIKEMIKDGRIQSVSIGAKVEDLTEEEDGSMKAIGIRGLELSLVAVPGDNQASLGQALQNSFRLKEMAMKEDAVLDTQLNGGKKEMSEEEEKTEEEEAKEEVKEEAEEEKEKEVEAEAEAEEVATEKSEINIKLDSSELTEMKAQIKELKELLVQKKQLKEEMEEDKKEAEDETKGEVSDDKEEALEKVNELIVERAKQGFAVYRDYTNESSDTNLKRLIR